MRNKEKRKVYSKVYREINREKLKAYDKIYREANREKCRADSKAYHRTNRDRIRIRQKDYRETNKEKIAATQKLWRKANPEKLKACQKLWYKVNSEKVNANRRAYNKRRRKMDPKFRLNVNISKAINISLNGNKKGFHWEDLVGYTLEKLRKHLEKQFVNGMRWENYGINGWHIDHKIPISVFNYTKPEHRDFKRCWALKNLQPLWATENISKSDKLIEHFQPSLLI